MSLDLPSSSPESASNLSQEPAPGRKGSTGDWHRGDASFPSRAVAQAVLKQQGTGRSRDPFCYWLPAREDMMRPDGGTKEELQGWNDRILVELVERMDDGGTKPSEAAPGKKWGLARQDAVPVPIFSERSKPSEATPGSKGEEASTETAMTAQEPETTPPQPAPLPNGLAADATALAAGPEESKLTDPPDTTPPAETAEAGQNAAVRETPVRLPFPFNIMKPEDVPEEVWHRARMEQEKNW